MKDVEVYNIRTSKIINHHSFENQNMVIIDYGRELDERSAIFDREWSLSRIWPFYNLNYQINNI